MVDLLCQLLDALGSGHGWSSVLVGLLLLPFDFKDVLIVHLRSVFGLENIFGTGRSLAGAGDFGASVTRRGLRGSGRCASNGRDVSVLAELLNVLAVKTGFVSVSSRREI